MPCHDSISVADLSATLQSRRQNSKRNGLAWRIPPEASFVLLAEKVGTSPLLRVVAVNGLDLKPMSVGHEVYVL